jgi:hypothetical protein
VVRFPKRRFFLENRLPAEAGLIDFHKEPTEQLVVVVQRKSVVIIMIRLVQGLSLVVHGLNRATVGHKVRFLLNGR